jgi:hypothetical protein
MSARLCDFFSYQPSRIQFKLIEMRVRIADNWKRLSCSLKIWKKFVHVSLMRREVDMGLDCIFDTLIPAYLDFGGMKVS